MNPESKRPIEIEDLLRLKRTERPRPEFWNEFDRQLRAKQLTAIMAKRPWWQTMPHVFSGFSRYHVPLGATAILAVTFIFLRDFRSTSPESSKGPVVQPAATAAGAVVEHRASNSPSDTRERVATDVIAAEILAPTAVAAIEESAARAPLASEATSPGELSRMIPLLGHSGAEPARNGTGSSAHYVAASLTAASTPEPVLSRSLLAATNAFEARLMPRVAIEPLQQITPPSERTRAKLLTAMVSRPAVETRMRTTEDVGSRLREDRLYEQVRRFGAHGAGLNIKL